MIFTQSPLIKENQKTPILNMIQKNPREEGLFLALADLLLPGFDRQIENAIDSDNDTLIEAAERAKRLIASAKASAGKKLVNLEPAEITKLAIAATGDAVMGEKIYTRYTGYVGNQKVETPKQVRARRPELLLERAIRGMVPHNKLGDAIFKKLKVVVGSDHSHDAQQPEVYEIK